MGKLSLKKKKQNNLPYGKFRYEVIFKRTTSRYNKKGNAGKIQPIRDRLDSSGQGIFRFDYYTNYYRKRIYTRLFLIHPMDLAILKLCHGDLMFKIYEIEIFE